MVLSRVIHRVKREQVTVLFAYSDFSDIAKMTTLTQILFFSYRTSMFCQSKLSSEAEAVFEKFLMEWKTIVTTFQLEETSSH